MRYLTLLLICCLWYVSEAGAQLRMEPEQRLHISSPDSILSYFRTNQVEYGFLAWRSNSGWLTMEDQLYGLLRQNGRWYLAQFTIPKFPKLQEHKEVYFRQKQIPKRQARELLRGLNIGQAFKYGVHSISALPPDIEYREGDATVILGGPTHFNYWHILEFSRRRVRALEAYAPDWYLENFLTYEPAFAILRPLVFTHSSLISQVKAALTD